MSAMCSQCHEREAVIRLTQVQEDQVVTLRLCERCAAERGVETGVGQDATPLGGFLAVLGGALDRQESGTSVVCPGCGATLENFRVSGRLGCAACWDTFAGSLVPLVRRLHGAAHHGGVSYHPPGIPDGGRAAELARLAEQLDLAIATENFELAAELRDRIRTATHD